jgi:dTMP kinase
MLIAVEGLPGSGKTTQARLLTGHLNRSGRSAVFLPDNLTRAEDPLGQTLLEIFDSGDPFARHGSVVTDTFLAAAIRANTFPAFIAPALAGGAVVVEDRGLHTMYSYSLATLLQKHHAPAGPAICWLTAVGALASRAADCSLWLSMPNGPSAAKATPTPASSAPTCTSFTTPTVPSPPQTRRCSRSTSPASPKSRRTGPSSPP